jgi:two-component system LytT family response regulator/two-component system response regulator LytT
MSLSAVIVDDEQLARDELAYQLKSVGDVEVVAEAHNGLEAVNLIKEHAPDLVFLDVQMPGLDGFGVIKKLIDKISRCRRSSSPPLSTSTPSRPSRSTPSITC